MEYIKLTKLDTLDKLAKIYNDNMDALIEYIQTVGTSRLVEVFVANQDQDTFKMEKGTFERYTNSVMVFSGGCIQILGSDYVEVENSTIRFLNPLVGGTVVIVMYTTLGKSLAISTPLTNSEVIEYMKRVESSITSLRTELNNQLSNIGTTLSGISNNITSMTGTLSDLVNSVSSLNSYTLKYENPYLHLMSGQTKITTIDLSRLNKSVTMAVLNMADDINLSSGSTVLKFPTVIKDDLLEFSQEKKTLVFKNSQMLNIEISLKLATTEMTYTELSINDKCVYTASDHNPYGKVIRANTIIHVNKGDELTIRLHVDKSATLSSSNYTTYLSVLGS